MSLLLPPPAFEQDDRQVSSLHSFFQIKVDIPPECRIYPIESEDEEEEARAASRGAGVGAKEIICPWESLTPQNGTG